jgi:hypothetical protein
MLMAMSTASIPTTPSDRVVRPAPGWLLATLAAGYGALFAAGLYFVTGLHERPGYPAPGEGAARIVAYFGSEVADVRTSVFLSVAAEIVLGLFTVLVSSRLRATGRPTIAGAVLYAGFTVAFLQLISHVAEWAATFPGLGSGGTLAVYYLSYGLGGPAFSLAMGVFVGLLAIGGRSRLAPAWIVVVGLVIAVVGVVSWGNLIAPEQPILTILIPLTRFPALIWLVLFSVCAALRPAPGAAGSATARGAVR